MFSRREFLRQHDVPRGEATVRPLAASQARVSTETEKNGHCRDARAYERGCRVWTSATRRLAVLLPRWSCAVLPARVGRGRPSVTRPSGVAQASCSRAAASRHPPPPSTACGVPPAPRPRAGMTRCSDMGGVARRLHGASCGRGGWGVWGGSGGCDTARHRACTASRGLVGGGGKVCWRGPLFSPLQLPAALSALALGSPTDAIPLARRPCRRGPPSPRPQPPLPPRWSAAALTVSPASAGGDRPPPPSPAAHGPSPPSRMRPPPRMRWRCPPPPPRPLHPATTNAAAMRSRRPWRPVRLSHPAAAAAATGVARTTMTTTTPAAGAPPATVRCRPRTQLPSRQWGGGCQSRYPWRPRARTMAARWWRWRRRWRGAWRWGRPRMRPPQMDGVARRRPPPGARPPVVASPAHGCA